MSISCVFPHYSRVDCMLEVSIGATRTAETSSEPGIIVCVSEAEGNWDSESAPDMAVFDSPFADADTEGDGRSAMKPL